jgi:tetratricopeptide (TPR) repeat protein
MGVDWNAHIERERARYEDGQQRVPDEPDARQRQLTRIGNAAYGAGLASLMLGRTDDARDWLSRAVEAYRDSYADAPPGSWGRLVALLKSSILAGDWEAARAHAEQTVAEGAADADSPIARYAATLALLTLGRDEDARPVVSSIRERDDFPPDVADSLATIAAEDPPGYTLAIESVLESFDQRTEYLEDIPVADTVIVLQALAAERGMAAELSSPLLPPS